MDLKKKIEETVETLKSNPKLLEQFKSDPVAALESLLGIDLPEDQIKPLIAGIQAKLAEKDVSKVLGKLGKFF